MPWGLVFFILYFEMKIEVVYYSATGNTKNVAEKIVQITGGDIFEIEPTEPYTDDALNWTNADSRVSREYAGQPNQIKSAAQRFPLCPLACRVSVVIFLI